MKGVIKVSLKPLEAKTIELKAEAKFNYSNRHITETLGIANLEVQYLTLNGVSDTSSKSITLNGIAPAGKTGEYL